MGAKPGLFSNALEALPERQRRYATPEQQREVIKLVSEGVAYETALRQADIHPIAWTRTMSLDASLASAFTRARLEALEMRSDRLLDEGDDIYTLTQLGVRRLNNENLRWLLSKRLPRQYGEALALTVSTGPDARRAMARAQGRVDALEPDVSDAVTVEDEVERLW